MSPSFVSAVTAIAGCLDNVFVTDTRVDVQGSGYSALEAQLACMTELWSSEVKWKYFINLSGEGFKLEEVRISINCSKSVTVKISRQNISVS